MFWFAFFACSQEQVYMGDDLATVGLKYSLKTSGSSTIKSYRVVDGGQAVPATELIGIAGDCLTAQTVAGTRTELVSFERESLLQVIAHTPLNHPLVPDSEDVFSEREAMVLQERSAESAVIQVEETLYDPSSASTFSTQTYNDQAQSSSASYFGVTADEYAVRFELSQLWNEFEELDPSDVTLLTKNNPEVGDVWTSVNGNIIFIYAGQDVLNLGALPTEVHKVEVYEVGGLQLEGADVFSQCLDIGLSQFQSNNPADTQYDLEEMFLLSGCEDNFTHVKTGTQWWYKNLLIKEEVTEQSIEITDYGFEWFNQDETGLSCTRVTSLSESGDPLIIAQPFVEYVLSTTTYVTELGDWSEPQ